MDEDIRESGCLCQFCNFRYKVDIMIPDSLWNEINNGFNLLCGMCIMQLMEGLDRFDYFDLLKLEEATNVSD